MALEYPCKDLIFKIDCDIRTMEGVYPHRTRADKTLSDPMPFDDHSTSQRSTGLLNHWLGAHQEEVKR